MTQLIQANKTHIAIISALARKIWLSTYSSILSAKQIDYMLNLFYSNDALNEQMTLKNHVFYLAQNENGIFTGFVSYQIDCEPSKTKIHKIYVLPETQKRGTGRLFFEKVKAEAEKANQTAIFLNVNKQNNARHFYEKIGFSIVKEEVIDISSSYVMDDYVMELQIIF